MDDGSICKYFSHKTFRERACRTIDGWDRVENIEIVTKHMMEHFSQVLGLMLLIELCSLFSLELFIPLLCGHNRVGQFCARASNNLHLLLRCTPRRNGTAGVFA